jgi:hypothetical protein
MNNKIISIIQRLADHNSTHIKFHPEEALAALAYGYYYVRPGEDTEAFMEQIHEAIADAELHTENIYNEENYSALDSVRNSLAIQATIILRNYFDEDFFNEQVERIAREVPDSQNALDHYVAKFNEQQLREFYSIIHGLRGQDGFFVSNLFSEHMRNELNNECLKMDISAPSLSDFYDDNVPVLSKNSTYFFDYLDKEKIANILLEHIDYNKSIAGNVARTLFYTNDTDTRNYTLLTVYLEDNLNMRIINPLTIDSALDDRDILDVGYYTLEEFFNTAEGKNILNFFS